MRLVASLLCLVASAACTKKNPEFCEANSECDTGFCNLDLHKCESLPDGGDTIDASTGIDADTTPRITVTTDGTGSGTVVSTPSGINCGAICDAVFPGGTEVTLDTVPDDGSILVDWGGACAGFEPCVLTVDAPTEVSATINQVGEFDWSKRVDVSLEGFLQDVAYDPVGNILVTGRFRGVANLGGDSLTSDSLSEDVFVAKFTSAGDHVWSKRFGGATNDAPTAIAVDGDGNVVVSFAVGYTALGGFFDPQPHGDWRLVHLAGSDGSTDWTKSFTITDTGGVVRGVGTDDAGNIIAGGDFMGTIDFDGDAQEMAAGSSDLFIAYYNAAGSPIRFQSPGSNGTDTLEDVHLDASGNAYLGGTFDGTTMFGAANAGGIDGYVAVLRPSGLALWSDSIGGVGNDRVFAIAAGATGEIYAAGHFEGAVDFGDGEVTPAGNADVFVTKYTALGDPDWVTVFGGSDSSFEDFPTDISFSNRGHIVTVGALNATADLGGGSLEASTGYFTLYVASFTANTGAHRWSRTFPSPDGDSGTLGFSVATTPRGDAAITGIYDGSVTVNGEVYPAPGGSFLTTFGP